jgi:DNA polymerase III epsilon subunit-like protein
MTENFQRHGAAFATEATAQHFIDQLKELFQINALNTISCEALRNEQLANTFLPPTGVIVILEASTNEIPQIQAQVMKCMGENLLTEQLTSWGI